MSNTILIKRSGTANSIPLAANVALGELAINYADGNLFYKDAGGTVRILTSTQFVSVAGNVTGGNINTAGLVSVTGNVTSSGNISGNYFLGNGALLTGVVATGIGTLASLSVTGNTDSGNLRTAGQVSATGNITSANTLNGAGLSLSGNVVSALVSAANITTTANISGNYILGNGALLTGVITSVANINLGTSNVTVVSSGGNVTVGVGGTSNVAVFATTGEYITGL